MQPRTKDMTSGSPTRLILMFSLPMIVSNLLQQVYSLVDSVVIGRLEGVTALTAVSASGWLDWAIISIAMGLSQGFAIQIAQSFGAGDHKTTRRACGQSILLSLMTWVLLETVAQLSLYPVLRLLKTPDDIIDLTALYLRIIFAGMPLIIGSNLLSGFLRSVGNSRTPLVAMVLATLTNIVLDIVFVATFRWGVAGVAVATSLAQGVSFLVCLWAVVRLPMLHPSKEDMRPDPAMMKQLIRLGGPIAFQYLVISVGGLILTRVVNGFGFIFVAGYNAAARLQGPLEMVGVSISASLGTFAGQNIGAGKLERVRQGVRSCAVITLSIALALAAIIIPLRREILMLFVQDDPAIVEQVLAYGSNFLTVMAGGVWTLYALFTYRSALQGLGDTFIPMLSGFVELAMRLGAALLLPPLIGEWGVYFAEVLAWGGAAVLLLIGYHQRVRKLEGRLGIQDSAR